MSKFSVTPWGIVGNIDYTELQEKFGTSPIGSTLFRRFARYNELHPMLKRGIFYSCRDADKLLDSYDAGNKFLLYTGRGPSGNTHLGHIMPWLFNKWIQDTFKIPMYFQITDDEKFLFKNLTLHDTRKMAYENALDFIAIGFDTKNTKIILNTECVKTLYPIALKVAKKINFSTAKAVFGFENSNNIGQIFYTAMQAAPAFLASEIEKKEVPCLIPCGIDQDPHFRAARDVASILGYPKPSMLYCKMLPGLNGMSKMSSSDDSVTIYTTDSPNVVNKKIGKAFTGGCISVREQRQKGGNPGSCVIFQYNYYMFEYDDNKLREMVQRCRGGDILCGECKAILAEKINIFLEKHQAKREGAREVIDSMAFGDFKW
ncbi:MAG: tryptophan--tRNA ligase [archaeon]|nr:tryptophan--tRNA ligase [archaeon]